MNKSKLYFLFIFAIFMISTNLADAGNYKLESDSCEKPTMSVWISNAYYADTDLDSYEDDVFVETKFTILCTNRANFDYYITLTLPSGMSFTYVYLVNTRLNSLTFNNDFYDHAIEAGDYQVDVLVVFKTGGVSVASDTLVFDPPGGSNTEPNFSLTWY